MNAHMREALTVIAKDTGAIVPCGQCGTYDLRNEDDAAADSMAYAMMTNAWKDGQFRSATLEESQKLMANILKSANEHCPSCGRF